MGYNAVVLEQLPIEYWLGFLALFGLFIGSFLNVVIMRLPAGEYLRWARPIGNIGGLQRPTSMPLSTV